jgi:hypothetical protein
MKTKLALIALFATPAFASPTVSGEAVVRWAHGPENKIIVDETLWHCSGEVCRGQVTENGVVLQRACRKLAQGAGWVESFRTPAQTFTTENLARCNRGKSPQAARVNNDGAEAASN